MSDNHNPDTNYYQADGLVWMKRNNHHFEFTNSKFKSLSKSVTHHTKMEVGGPSHKNANENGDTSEQSNCEESFSDQDILLNDEDVWDDSLLIKMYETSQKQINDELTKRFTSKDTEQPNVEVSSNNFDFIKKLKQKASHNKKTTPKASIPKPMLSKPMNWKENDYCQLTYLEDNVDYEAKIVSIDISEQTCLVRYIGYENEEVRNLVDLKPSEGEKVRKLQIEMSIQDGYGKPVGALEDAAPCDLPPLKHSSASIQLPNTSRIIPPPPPFLGEPHNTLLTNNQGALFEEDDDVLASMLMSWYMTGYHTGYYQARKDMKSTNR